MADRKFKDRETEPRFAGAPRGGGAGGGFGGRGGFQGGPGAGGFGAPTGPGFGNSAVAPNAFTDGVSSGGAESQFIHVKNLPWSTSNEDLVELFTTIGKVERAEIQYEPNGRSRGSGVVEFAVQGEANTAIGKFPRPIFTLFLFTDISFFHREIPRLPVRRPPSPARLRQVPG